MNSKVNPLDGGVDEEVEFKSSIKISEGQKAPFTPILCPFQITKGTSEDDESDESVPEGEQSPSEGEHRIKGRGQRKRSRLGQAMDE